MFSFTRMSPSVMWARHFNPLCCKGSHIPADTIGDWRSGIAICLLTRIICNVIPPRITRKTLPTFLQVRRNHPKEIRSVLGNKHYLSFISICECIQTNDHKNEPITIRRSKGRLTAQQLHTDLSDVIFWTIVVICSRKKKTIHISNSFQRFVLVCYRKQCFLVLWV